MVLTKNPSRQILVGLLAGAALGVFLGERAAPLQVLADAYVRLRQMTVLPSVAVSLIAGLGSLDSQPSPSPESSSSYVAHQIKVRPGT